MGPRGRGRQAAGQGSDGPGGWELHSHSQTGVPAPTSGETSGVSEQDPAAWWEATAKALQQLVAQGADLSGVAAVGLSGQMQSVILAV